MCSFASDTNKRSAGVDVLTFRVLRSDAALGWLADRVNWMTWTRLYDLCPWRLPTLSPEYFKIWSRHYRFTWDPVLVLATDEAGEYRGLAPLAAHADVVTGAGAHQAVYQGWLCAAVDGLRIFRGIIEVLRHELPNSRLIIRYLSNIMQIEQLLQVSRFDSRVRLAVHRTHILMLNPAIIRQCHDHILYQSNLSRHKRLGNLKFERIDANALSKEDLERIATLYDFCQGLDNGSCPFADDPRKLGFYRDWLAHYPEHLDVSILRFVGEINAVLLGLRSAKASHVAILAYAPENDHKSLCELHLYQSALALAEEDCEWLDLTPCGDGWMKYITMDQEPVLELVFIPSRFTAVRERMCSTVASLVRRLIYLCGSSPLALHSLLVRWRRLLPMTLVRRICKITYDHVEMRFYRLDLKHACPSKTTFVAKVNELADIIRFPPMTSWRSRQEFLSSAFSRMVAGERAFSVCDNQGLVHCGWLIRSQAIALISEVEEQFEYPKPGAVLYDFFTMPRARGQGHYQRTIREMLATLINEHEAEVVYISTRADNFPSRHVIEKESFEWFCSLHRRRFFGIEWRWRETSG